MKIGLVSVYTGYNYGSKLQAYAMQKILEGYGYSVDMINYNPRYDYRIHVVLKKLVLKIIKRKKGKVIDCEELKRQIDIRKYAISSFDVNYNLIKEIRGYNRLRKITSNYDLFVCGSDQLWSEILYPTGFYNLAFVGEKKKTISYAASFGTEKISETNKKGYIKFLKKIDYISVREQSAQKIVKELSGRNCKLVLDPTLLYGKSRWEIEITKISTQSYCSKYIFCYFLGNNPDHRIFAKNLSNVTGMPIIDLPYMKDYCECDRNFSEFKLFDVNPLQFVKIISKAEYVCTDSFHGTAFSILFNKKFFVAERYSKSSNESTNTRIYSLLSMLDLEARLMPTNANLELVRNLSLEVIDYNDVNGKLKKSQIESEEFLKGALNG